MLSPPPMRRSLLLVLLVAAIAATAAYVLFGTGGRDPRSVRAVPAESAEAPAAAPETAVHDVLLPPPVVREPSGEVTTTVLWPLKVELELVEARFLPKHEGAPAVG